MITAKQARKNVMKYKEKELNFQREAVLKMIEAKSKSGLDYIVLSDPRIRLFEEDYEFFRKLDFNVKPETHCDSFINFAIISW